MIVVGCGRRKQAVAAKARELYTGSLFRAARRYAEASGQRWVVLSAAHGVIDPDVVVRPYDQVLELEGDELARWARKAAVSIYNHGPTSEVVILAGARYAVPVVAELAELGMRAREPLLGLGMGRRLSWFKRETAKLRAASGS